MNHSLQQRLHVWLLSAITVFALVVGGISAWVAFSEAQELQDNQLQQVALLASRVGNTALINDSDPEDTLILQQLGRETAGSLPIPSTLADGLHTLELQGENWRVYVYTPVSDGNTANRHFVVSQRIEFRNEVAWGNSLATLLPIILLAPLLMAVISFAVSRSFLPVQALAKLVDQRDETSLDDLPQEHVPQELLPFTRSINRLLGRLRKAIAQQQRFVADAAHELRTPVTALSLLAENLANANTLEESRERLVPVQEGLERLRNLVSQLLGLARLQGETQANATPVDFRQVVQEVIAELFPLAEAKSIDLGMLRNESLPVQDVTGNLSILVSLLSYEMILKRRLDSSIK